MSTYTYVSYSYSDTRREDKRQMAVIKDAKRNALGIGYGRDYKAAWANAVTNQEDRRRRTHKAVEVTQ